MRVPLVERGRLLVAKLVVTAKIQAFRDVAEQPFATFDLVALRSQGGCNEQGSPPTEIGKTSCRGGFSGCCGCIRWATGQNKPSTNVPRLNYSRLFSVACF